MADIKYQDKLEIFDLLMSSITNHEKRLDELVHHLESLNVNSLNHKMASENKMEEKRIELKKEQRSGQIIIKIIISNSEGLDIQDIT